VAVDDSPAEAAAHTGGRPLRAHARRNRDALVVTARDAFTAGEVDIRVEEIARRAGVGVGTFYRHFATREAIIEAVYDQRVRDLCDAATDSLETMPPQEALRDFLYRLIQHAVDSRSMAVALTTVMDLGSPVFGEGRAAMAETISRLMAAAVAAGAIRTDVTSETVFRVMGSVCASHDQPDWETGAKEMVRLLYDGLRYTAPGS
jgi:AcrR family transcriptional regulator